MKKRFRFKCAVCGNTQFKTLDNSNKKLFKNNDDLEIKCSDCGCITTKERLIEENSYTIDANIEDLKEKFVEQIEKT